MLACWFHIVETGTRHNMLRLRDFPYSKEKRLCKAPHFLVCFLQTASLSTRRVGVIIVPKYNFCLEGKDLFNDSGFFCMLLTLVAVKIDK